MEVRTNDIPGVIFSVISVGASVVSFQPVAVWAFAVALVAIGCGIIGLLLLRTATSGRRLWSLLAQGAGVMGITLGAVKAIGWATPLMLHY